MRMLTGLLLLVPVGFFAGGLVAPPNGRGAMLVVGALVVLLYPLVWLCFRPTRFEVDGAVLRIVWPIRTRTIARPDVVGARIVDASELQQKGMGVRIGVGGLFGAFGLLRTRTATFSMWISRTDGLVLVTLRDARPLLVTPADPERFVAALLAR
jgi:hypothetical protein